MLVNVSAVESLQYQLKYIRQEPLYYTVLYASAKYDQLQIVS